MRPVPFAPVPGTVADHLRQCLLALDYPAFARCICVLLEALGYEEARPAGRQEWKGYNRPGGGGYDLEAVLPGGIVPRPVVAQIKQFDGLRVHQRSVDELRGACLRAGAAEALLITTSAFSDVVRRRAASSEPAQSLVAPVRLLDGRELLGLLIRHRLGVVERGQGHTRRLSVDEAFFAGMENWGDGGSTSTAMTPASASPDAPDQSPSQKSAGWRVTVQLSHRPVPAKRCESRKKGGSPKGAV